jgi:hypothetical protein
MTELAPQDQTGNYQRPKYSFGGTIGSQTFPIEAGRYHIYVGNPCPVSCNCTAVSLCHLVTVSFKKVKMPFSYTKCTLVTFLVEVVPSGSIGSERIGIE